MQAVIALPAFAAALTLETPVCGVPLFRRLIATACRSGATKVLLVIPPGWPLPWLNRMLRWRPIESIHIECVEIGHSFAPASTEAWHAISHFLGERFVYIPCDFLPHRAPLFHLLATAANHPHCAVCFNDTPGGGASATCFDKPAVLVKRNLLEGRPQTFVTATPHGKPGIPAPFDQTAKPAEVELVRHSGKITDGIYSTFNRKLCRPAVRCLSHTPVTPNAVSIAGLGVAVLAGLCLEQGSWLWNIAGAALFFLSGLIDEMDGMLARLKFQESPFGCWLETFADYSSYLLIFAGMAIGGYRRGGWIYLAIGAALLFGCALSFVVISIQRKLAAPADRPNEYSRLYLTALDRDSGNVVSRSVRQLQFLTKKGVLIHYLLLFAIAGALPLFLSLAALGANVAWMVTIYLNRRLFSPQRLRYGGLTSSAAAPGRS